MLKYLIIIAGWLCSIVPTIAQERLAIVIGNGGYPDFTLDRPAQNGIAVSQSLLGLGFDVTRFENVNAADHPLGNQSADTILLYFSGAISVEKRQTHLLSVDQQTAEHPSGWILSEVVKAYQDAGAKRVLVFLDTCYAGTEETENQNAPALEIPNVFQAQAGKPGMACPPESSAGVGFTETLLDALFVPNATLSDIFADKDSIWYTSSLAEPYIFRTEDSPTKGLSAADHEMLNRLSEKNRKHMLDLWRKAGIFEGGTANSEPTSLPVEIATVQNETILLTGPLQPLTILASVTPEVSPVIVRSIPQAQNGVRIFTAAASPSRQFRRTIAGLPTPSIIVGNVTPEDSFQNPTELGGSIAGAELESVSYEVRHTMRIDDPALFEKLLTSGAFDPALDALPRAIQTELTRMGCYSTRVDGVWGSGSRGAVDRYFKQIGAPATSREPVIKLYRQLLRKDDAICPVVQTATQRTTTTPRRNPSPSSTTPRTTRVPTKPATQTGPRKINRTLNPAGVFR